MDTHHNCVLSSPAITWGIGQLTQLTLHASELPHPPALPAANRVPATSKFGCKPVLSPPPTYLLHATGESTVADYMDAIHVHRVERPMICLVDMPLLQDESPLLVSVNSAPAHGRGTATTSDGLVLGAASTTCPMRVGVHLTFVGNCDMLMMPTNVLRIGGTAIMVVCWLQWCIGVQAPAYF